ncbi:MAG: phosphotransferase [Phycisphaerales bacterium]|nr:phosphotransferase [Phycisphaerales bacterium]
MPDEQDSMDRAPHLGPLHEEASDIEQIDGSDLAIVLSRYDIGSVERISDFKKGSRRAPKVVIRTREGDFILKRRAAGRDDLDRVEFAHAVQRRLAEHRFPVAGLVTSTEGETLVRHEGRIYELFRFIHGTRFDKSNRSAAEAGRVLAHMHDLLTDFPREMAPRTGGFHDPEKVVGAMNMLGTELAKNETADDLIGMEDTLGYLQEQYADAAKRIDAMEFASLPMWIVHGDWHPGNLLYQDMDIIAVLDFDSLHLARRVTDVANGALQLSMRMGDPDRVEEWPDTFRGQTIRSLVQAYDQFATEPLMASERTMIPDLMIEAMIVESVIPIARTGMFGTVKGSTFLRMIERKLRWLMTRRDRVIEVIQPPSSTEDSFN